MSTWYSDSANRDSIEASTDRYCLNVETEWIVHVTAVLLLALGLVHDERHSSICIIHSTLYSIV